MSEASPRSWRPPPNRAWIEALALGWLLIPWSASSVLAQGAGPKPAAPASAQGRWHFVFTGAEPFELSILFTRTTSGDETRLLVAAPSARFELVSRQDPTDLDSTETVKEIASSTQLSRRLLLSGFAGVAGCEGVRPPDACILFESAGGKVSTSLGRFAETEAPALRARVLAIVPEELKRNLLLLEPAFAVCTEFSAYGPDFLGLLWPGRFAEAKAPTPRGQRTRGCDFDSTFGFPCGPDERRREDARFGKGR